MENRFIIRTFVTKTNKKFFIFNFFFINLSSENAEKSAGNTKQINSTISFT